MRRAAACVMLLIASGVARTAAAQDAGVPTPSVTAEIAQLEQEIARGAATLSSGGCDVACRALASMERAAERLCTLDPGPRCADARAKVRDATRRVQEACVDCRSGGNEIRAAEQKQTTPRATPPPEPPPPPPPAPTTVSRRGGCAGCATSGDETTPQALMLAAIAIAALRLRRRR